MTFVELVVYLDCSYERRRGDLYAWNLGSNGWGLVLLDHFDRDSKKQEAVAVEVIGPEDDDKIFRLLYPQQKTKEQFAEWLQQVLILAAE